MKLRARHFQGLRGDDARTATRAIGEWRKAQIQRATELVEVREIRIAKSQPRSMPPGIRH